MIKKKIYIYIQKGKYKLRPEDDEIGYVENFSDNEVNYDYESLDDEYSEADIFDVSTDDEKEELKDAKGNVLKR